MRFAGLVGVLLTAVLLPVSVALFALRWVRPRRRWTRAATALLGASILPLAGWFGGRADERPMEGVIAAVLLLTVLGALVAISGADRAPASADRDTETPSI